MAGRCTMQSLITARSVMLFLLGNRNLRQLRRDFQGRFSHCVNEGSSVYALSGANSPWRAGTALISIKVYSQGKGKPAPRWFYVWWHWQSKPFFYFFFLHGSMLFDHHKALSRLYISFSVGLRQTGNLTRITRLSWMSWSQCEKDKSDKHSYQSCTTHNLH